jgi:hypothetical protein
LQSGAIGGASLSVFVRPLNAPVKLETKIIAAVALLCLAIVPLPSTVTPKVVIRVVDESGNPVSGVVVYRNWKHFGLHRSGNSDTHTGQTGEAVFTAQTASGSLCSRALILLGALSPHMSFGSRTHIEIYPPVEFELRLSQPDFSAVSRSGDFASCRSKSGDNVFIDYRPPDAKATIHYSVRVCLDYDRTSPTQFTLPVRRVGHQSQ